MRFEDCPVNHIPDGAILAHSMILNGKRLSKGHVLSHADISDLKSASIESATIVVLEEEDIHEDIAADRIAGSLSGGGVSVSRAFTGRSNIFAEEDGLLCLDESCLSHINHLDEAVTVATLPNYQRVSRKQMVGTVKIIPFSVTSATLSESLKLADAVQSPIIVRPFSALRCAMIQTRLPVTKESVLDKTTDVLSQRITSLGGSLVQEIRCEHTVAALARTLASIDLETVDLVLITGASAVTDRRDVLPAGLDAAGGDIIHFGMPVDPGNLLLMGRLEQTPVIGMPGCARSPKLNGFDWVLQRIFAGIVPTGRDIMDMGIGGLLTEIQSRPQPRNERKRPEKRRDAKITAIILAAGRSTRMGPSNKLLAELNGKPMLAHILNTLNETRVKDLVVVTGHEHRMVEEIAADFNAALVHNPDYRDGMSTSLKRGISAVPKDSDAAIICLGDMPFVSVDVIDGLIAAYNPTEGRDLCVPTVDGRRGNPVLIGRRYFAEIHEISGDKGARDLIRAYETSVCEVAIDDPTIFHDIDTPDALNAATKKG